DFLPVEEPKPIEAEHIDEAMPSLSKAVRSFLATPHSGGAIARLQLKLYLINNYAFDVGSLVTEAIDIGILKDLNLAILDEVGFSDSTKEHMLQQACLVDFFSDHPSLSNCLTRLSLYSVCFSKWDINHCLFDCCQQLQHLYISNCDSGLRTPWKINAPDSKLSVLELSLCVLAKLEIVCLPKLEHLEWDTWFCSRAPLSLGLVPSLKKLYLICPGIEYIEGFILSEVLSDTTSVHTLKLDFQGEKIWLQQPERKQPCTSFNTLRKLSIHGIFVRFSLLWMRVLLEATPLLEMFDIEIWEHPCQINDSWLPFGERTNPSWKVPELTSGNNCFMKEFQIIGLKPLEQQMEFLSVVLQRGPNLETVILKYDDPCEDCEKMGIFPPRSSTDCVFPKNKDEKDLTVNLLKTGLSSRARIIF
ncbi:hypothetical protein EJB05_10809, partial [Eragrostis curvula]